DDQFQGLGTVHADGTAVLGGIAGDLYMDDRPSLAVSSTGETLLAWTKEEGPYDVSFGSRPMVARRMGNGWSAPVAVDDELHFSKHAAATYDATDRPVVVWSRAD